MSSGSLGPGETDHGVAGLSARLVQDREVSRSQQRRPYRLDVRRLFRNSLVTGEVELAERIG